MKRIILIVIILLIIPACAYAFEIPQIEGYSIFEDTANQIISGDFAPGPLGIFGNIINSLTAEMKSFSSTAAAMLVMALLSSTVGTLNNAVGEKSSAQAAFFTFFAAISGLALVCFSKAIGYATEVVFNMTSFMTKLTPVIILMLFTCCRSASAAAFEPVLSASVFVAAEVIEKCLVPLVTFSAVLSVAGNVGDKNSISGFVRIVKSITKWIMALVITVFTGINTVYGFTAPALDAVGAKAMKFAVGSLVPVVGGFLSDTLDTVASSATVMKNTVGVSGIVVVCTICVAPVIKIGIMQLMLKLISAVVEPITDKRICSMLWDMSDAVTAVFGIVVLTAVLFLINICIILRVTG